jgi:carboxymethylenebutenolidase
MSTGSVEVACANGVMTMRVWEPAQPPQAAMLVIQEIFGVGAYIEAVCQRLADAGYLAAAPDVFWRFAPGWAADHDRQGLEQSLGKVQQLDVPLAIEDCVRALDVLAARPGISAAGVIGFCLGGTLAWGVASSGTPAACVSYYGSGVPNMLGVIDQIACPTLLHFGSDDAYIPGDGVEAISAAIAGRPGFVLNVEQAGHAFDNHESEMFHHPQAAAAAWSKTMAFLGSHLPA